MQRAIRTAYLVAIRDLSLCCYTCITEVESINAATAGFLLSLLLKHAEAYVFNAGSSFESHAVAGVPFSLLLKLFWLDLAEFVDEI
jgi:hypothetical protein